MKYSRDMYETGKTYNRWTILGRLTNKYCRCICACECGVVKEVCAHSLFTGVSKSCGCYDREVLTKRNTSHGMNRTPVYKAWQHMKERCYDLKNSEYHRYGGRGIMVCSRWQDSFENFFEDMGDKPSKEHSLDRINVNGNYEPENCRWATIEQQANNKEQSIKYEFRGEILTMKQISRIIGIPYTTLITRRNKGWDFERIVTEKTFRGKNQFSK